MQSVGGTPNQRMKWRGLDVLAVLITSTWLTVAWFDVAHWNLDQPLSYSGDAFPIYTWTKTMMDHGWWFHNPQLGWPFGMETYEYLTNPNFHYACLKGLTWLHADAFWAVNIYFLLSFPLTAVSAYLVFRHWKIDVITAHGFALLFAFLPYHLVRGIPHLFLVSYFLIPPVVMIALWLAGNHALFLKNRPSEDEADSKINWGWSLLAVGLCFLLGFDFPYYPLFGCFLFVLAGVLGAIQYVSWRPLLRAGVLIGITASGFVLNLLPNLVHLKSTTISASPDNDGYRHFSQADHYGFRLSQYLLPRDDHYVAVMGDLQRQYQRRAQLPAETTPAGLLASLGTLLLFGWLLLRPWGAGWCPALDRLASLNVMCFLLASVGGIGLLVNLVMGGSLRCYGRISIFLCFFGLSALALLIKWLVDSTLSWGWPMRLVTAMGVGAITYVGLIDQLGDPLMQQHSNEGFLNDQRFFAQLQRAVPENGSVVVYPYSSFLSRMNSNRAHAGYDAFRGYLHTQGLRWNYGVLIGHAGDVVYQQFARWNFARQMHGYRQLGFDGVWINRQSMTALEKSHSKDWGSAFEGEPIESDDGKHLFFSFAQLKPLPGEIDAQEYQTDQTLPIGWRAGEGMGPTHYDPQGKPFCYVEPRSSVWIYNHHDQDINVYLTFTLQLCIGPVQQVDVRWADQEKAVPIRDALAHDTLTVLARPGWNRVEFYHDNGTSDGWSWLRTPMTMHDLALTTVRPEQKPAMVRHVSSHKDTPRHEN